MNKNYTMSSNSLNLIPKIKSLFLRILKEIPKLFIRFFSEMDLRLDFSMEIWLKGKDNLRSTHSKLEKRKY